MELLNKFPQYLIELRHTNYILSPTKINVTWLIYNVYNFECKSVNIFLTISENGKLPRQRFVYYDCRIIIGCTGSSPSQHYTDVIMISIASQITSLKMDYLSVYSGANQIKHQSSASLAFVRGIHRRPVNSLHKGPATRKMFPFDDVIMRMYDSNNTKGWVMGGIILLIMLDYIWFIISWWLYRSSLLCFHWCGNCITTLQWVKDCWFILW